MSNKHRSPLQVSDKFLTRLKDLQRKIRMKTGDEKSLREITDNIVSSTAFRDFEESLLKGDIEIGLSIKFDGRKVK